MPNPNVEQVTGPFKAVCPDCGWTTFAAYEEAAEEALTDHIKIARQAARAGQDVRDLNLSIVQRNAHS